MKRLILPVLTSAILLAALSTAEAQTYKSAIGVRLGSPLSLSFKTFISEKSALEVYAGYRGYTYYNWFSANGAYLIHFPISAVEGLQWYVGGGAGVYFFNYDDTFITSEGTTGIAVQGYLGLDYKFAEIPLNLTADWVPSYFVSGYGSGFGGGYGALGVRYVLGGN